MIVRYRGEGARPEGMLQRIRQAPGVSVVDDTGRMLLVEAPAGAIERVVGSDPNWLVVPEQTYKIPDTRKRIERPPRDE